MVLSPSCDAVLVPWTHAGVTGGCRKSMTVGDPAHVEGHLPSCFSAPWASRDDLGR